MILLLLAALSLPAQTAKRQLTIDDIFDRAKRLSIAVTMPRSFTWADDTHFYYAKSTESGEVTGFALVDSNTGQETALFEPSELEAQVAKVEGISSDEAKKISRPRSIVVDWGTRGVLLTIHDQLYIYNINSKSLTQLTTARGDVEEATFSPDGKLVAFARDNNLYIFDVASKVEKQLTTDGSAKLLNGLFDWVYQEEIYGRGLFKAYWWSPDSKSIAYLKLDDSRVPEFMVVDHIPMKQKLESTPYPRPGDPNPAAALYVVDLASGQSLRLDRIPDPSSTLIVDVAWRPDSSAVAFQVQDREQTYLDLNEVPRGGGPVRNILRETTKAWVNNTGSPFFLKDGSFFWQNEHTGWQHIYRVAKDGTQKAVTSGNWEVQKVFGVDEKNGWIYYSSTERDPIGVDVYRIRFDGTRKQRLTDRPGTHSATFNDSLTRFVESWSDVATPPQLSIIDSTGKTMRMIRDQNASHELEQLNIRKPELVHVPTRDGFIMEAEIIRPPDFDPAKKYPVYEHTYSGPHAPQVKNAWGGTTYLFHQLLAQRGIVVWICDNRTASGKGAQSAWPLYKNFGELELRDLEDGLAWITSQPGIDGTRALLNGWSFGGYMTMFALTHSKKWSAGIAGGIVNDWHNYDSVYTERFMLTPEHNKEGYERSSPLKAAANLNAKLLMLHGAIDDNVHTQNTIQLVYALQKAGKPFEMMLYPKSRHGITDPDLNKQLHLLSLDFVMRNLIWSAAPMAPLSGGGN